TGGGECEEDGAELAAESLSDGVLRTRRPRRWRTAAGDHELVRPGVAVESARSNERQDPSLGLVCHYAAQAELPLLDLKDLRAVLTYLTSDDGKAELKSIGGLS